MYDFLLFEEHLLKMPSFLKWNYIMHHRRLVNVYWWTLGFGLATEFVYNKEKALSARQWE